ncbi:hypothetical protein GGTG_13802 [Gaeumannomyces tritici R3-111a-1]|uniref:Uncharacterized protein n=1 Tax=Gaeumannomyces tritici (strain R3-111a-1) TaxID=644352 RepID=J3PJW0_GAET3|nr:hypothetical protein GGTG_13802 [Gaeumannomyces tritici R3-111a-1]EJT68624.1 hypothetical protein GGTG_13802 [Gaeumannomyces tritici R3-111a-1]
MTGSCAETSLAVDVRLGKVTRYEPTSHSQKAPTAYYVHGPDAEAGGSGSLNRGRSVEAESMAKQRAGRA